jgi:hypothetical protein
MKHEIGWMKMRRKRNQQGRLSRRKANMVSGNPGKKAIKKK